MGCGASSVQAVGPARFDKDAQDAQWKSLACDPELAKQLRAAGLAYSTACALVQFGVEEQSHVALLQPEDVTTMQLNTIQRRLLLRLLQGPGAWPAAESQPRQSGGIAVPNTGAAMQLSVSEALQEQQDPPAGKTLQAGHTSQAGQTASATHQDVSEPAVDEDEHLPARDRLKKLHTDKHKLMNLVKDGLNLGVKFLDVVGPILPIPGPSAAKLLSTIMSHCSKALANKTNMHKLAEKCAYLMGLLAGHLKPASSPVASESGMTAERAYRDLMGQFRDMLKRAERYCAEYTKRAWLWRTLNSPGDDKEYNALVKTLAQLIAEATLAVSLDCQSQGVNIRADIKKLAGDVEAQLAFVDTGRQLREFVKQKGGIDVIMADPAMMQQAAATMDASQQLCVELLKRHMESYTIMAMDRGAHTNIRHPDLREMWFKASFGECKVRWEAWWTVLFPRRMEDMLQPEEYKELCALMESEAAQTQFKRAVDEYEEDYISVDELYLKFPPDVNVLARTKELIAYGKASTSTAEQRIPAGVERSSGSDSAGPSHRAVADNTSCGTGKAKAACLLPGVDKDTYVGRDSVATELCTLLTGSKTTSSETACRAVLLLGPGGLGKFTLASDVGWRLWEGGHISGGAAMVNLRDATTLEQQLQRLCQAFIMPYDDTARPRVLSRLADLQADQHMLLVLDNAEDCSTSPEVHDFAGLITEMLEASTSLLLVITSTTPWPSKHPLHGCTEYALPQLDGSSTQQLLRSLCPADVLPDAQLEAVGRACKGSPMMMHLMASALEAGRLTVEDIITHSTSRTVDDQAYTLVLKSLRKQQLQQLTCLTVFPHMFDEEDAAAVLSCSTEEALSTLEVLRGHSLLEYDNTRGQNYMQMSVRQQVTAYAEQPVVASANEAFVQLFLARLSTWAQLYKSPQFSLALSKVRHHTMNLKTVWELVDSGSLSDVCIEAVAEAATETMAELMQAASLYYNGAPSWSKLQQHTFASTRNWANVARRAADMEWEDFTKAETQNRHVWEQLSKAFGENDVDVITSLSQLAECLTFQGKYADAEPLYRSVLELSQGVLDPEHPDMISRINNLAVCLDSLGQYSAAEPMYRRALEQRQRVLGAEHPDTMNSVNNLAGCLQSMGRYAAAEPMYRSALELRQHVLGDEHSSTIASVNNLAGCLRSLGKYAGAEPMYRNALELSQRLLGAEHPDTIGVMNNLAGCLNSMGHYDKAEPMIKSVMELSQQVIGQDHPDTISSTSNVAVCLDSMGKHAAAEPILRSTLEHRQRVLGTEHPDTITSTSNLARCLHMMDQHTAAKSLCQEALEHRQRLLGPEHPDTIDSLTGLAWCLMTMGQHTAAEPMFRNALELRQRVLGLEHPDTIISICNLVKCLQSAGPSVTPDSIIRSVLDGQQPVLGPAQSDALAHSLKGAVSTQMNSPCAQARWAFFIVC